MPENILIGELVADGPPVEVVPLVVVVVVDKVAVVVVVVEAVVAVVVVVEAVEAVVHEVEAVEPVVHEVVEEEVEEVVVDPEVHPSNSPSELKEESGEETAFFFIFFPDPSSLTELSSDFLFFLMTFGGGVDGEFVDEFFFNNA